MGAAQSIPVIGEIVTVLDSGTRTIAAGVCEVVGDDKDAKELIKGAGNSWKHYSEVNLLVANARVVYYKARGDEKDAHDILKKEGEAWTDIGENTPGVGHVVSLVRYVEGDKEGAKRAFMAATRSTLVVAATVATGGVGGAAVAAGAAALTGIAADGVMTGINSLDEHKFAPVGTFAGVAQAGKSKSVNDWITAAEIPIGDAVSGAVQGGLRTTISRPKPFPMVATAADQIPMETLKSNSHTAHFVQEFDNAEAALSHLKNQGDQKYNFVQLANGKIRVISHNDIAEASNHITNQGSAGHSSLVEPGHPVHAAGELHIQDGFVKNINCQSGHYRVPLRYMARQLDTAFPQEFLTFRSPGMARVMRRLQGGKDKSKSYPDMKDIAIYAPHLLVITMTHNKESVTLHNAHYAVAFYENNHVITVGLADQRSAQAVYDNLPSDYTKALIKRREAKILSSHGHELLVQECKNEAEEYKSFVVMDGLHLTVPLHEASYIVSFYRKDCVKMVGCPNREFGQKVYKHVDQNLAKVLVDRRGHKVLDSSVGNADQKQLEQCKDHVMKLPALDEAVPLEGAPWILLWYQNNSVQAIGFHGVEAAEAAYNAISSEYPKILAEKGKSDISKSSGNVDRCKESLSMLRNITQALPLPNARFVTATHMGDHVRLIGFPTYDAATVFHNVSNRDRIVFDRRISQKLRAYMRRDDDQRWINLCEMRAKQLPELREIDIPYGQYLVVVHFKDHVYMIALPDENSAKIVFEGIDNRWSAILTDHQGKSLSTKGSNTGSCSKAVQELTTLRTTTSLQAAQYILAYHQGSCVRLIGFDKEGAARNLYDAMSKDSAKIIAKRGDEYPIASHGSDPKVKECVDEIRKFFPLETPKKSAVESPDRPSVKIDDNDSPNAGADEGSDTKNNEDESEANSDNEPDVDDGSDNEPSTQDNGDNESNDDGEPDADGNGSDESDVENNDDPNAEVSSNNEEGGNSDEEKNDESQEDQSDDMDPSEDQSLDGSDQESELSQNDDDGGEPGMSDSDNKSLEGSEQDEEEENQDQSNSENDDEGNGSGTDTVDDPDQEAEDDVDGVESDAENNDGEVDDAGSNEDGDQEEKNEMDGSEVEEDNNSETDEVDPTEDEPVEGFNSGDSDRDQSDNNSENGNEINDEEASDLDQDGDTNDVEGESGEDTSNDDESANASDQGESENQSDDEDAKSTDDNPSDNPDQAGDDESQDEGENEEEGGEEEGGEEEEGEGGEDEGGEDEGGEDEGGENEGGEDEGGEDEGGEDDEANDDQDQNEESENDDQDDNGSGTEEGSTNENDEPEFDDEEANDDQDQNEEEDGVEDQDNENESGDDFDEGDEGENGDAQEADMQEEDNEDNDEDTNDYDQENDENNDEDTNDYDQEGDEDNGAQEDENDYNDQNNDDYGEENMDGMDQGGDGQESDQGDSNNDYEDNGEQDYD